MPLQRGSDCQRLSSVSESGVSFVIILASPSSFGGAGDDWHPEVRFRRLDCGEMVVVSQTDCSYHSDRYILSAPVVRNTGARVWRLSNWKHFWRLQPTGDFTVPRTRCASAN